MRSRFVITKRARIFSRRVRVSCCLLARQMGRLRSVFSIKCGLAWKRPLARCAMSYFLSFKTHHGRWTSTKKQSSTSVREICESLNFNFHPFRLLQDLPMSEDPAWTYFDSQHKWIMEQMNKTYEASVKAVNGTPKLPLLCKILRLEHVAALEKTATDESDPDALPNLLASQLHNSLAALEKKQADAIVGRFLTQFCLSPRKN